MATQKTYKKIQATALVFIFTLVNILSLIPVTSVNAYTNILKGGDFENGLSTYWTAWQDSGSSRVYNVNRSYDAAFGNGSYSIIVEAVSGSPAERWQANMSGEVKTNTLKVDAGKAYQVSFYSKSNQTVTVGIGLQDGQSVTAISRVEDVIINSTSFGRKIITLYPTASSLGAILVVQYGDMPTGSSFNLDGMQIMEASNTVTTTEVKGYIGDQNKTINVSNISFYNLNEVEVELPYYDPATSQPTTKKFAPVKIDTNSITLNMYPGTFAGVGKVYANSQFLGSFNYNIQPKITEFYPSIVRVDQDLTIYGSGFNPELNYNKTYVIMKSIDTTGKVTDTWIKPHTIDPMLSQITIKLPVGVVYGSMYISSAFRNMNDVDVINKSNNLSYTVKPVIYGIGWTKKGYEQVGDSLTIRGKGMAYAPSVKFYDASDKVVATVKAKLVSMGTEEAIEVVTPTSLNSLSITVTSGGVESDKADALSYVAKPTLLSVKTKQSRINLSTNTTIQAAKTGEEITLSGRALYSPYATTSVEFQGQGQRIVVVPTSVDTKGTVVKAVVPEGVQNGYVNVTVLGEKSNYMPLEIIPTVITVAPTTIMPGGLVTITASGMSDNVNLARVHFQLTKTEESVVMPESITMNGNIAMVITRAPMALAGNTSSVRLQYDKWLNDSSSNLSVNPYISSASIDTETNILSIKGYGFSIVPKENAVTYKYADANKTVVTPKVTMLGVYPTEEGQEIRIKILDNYYYGFVTVAAGDKVSNEANFGPVVINKIARRTQYVAADNKTMGVLYISGYNFGQGAVMVGGNTARTDYRTDFFIIAVIPAERINDNPVIVTKN